MKRLIGFVLLACLIFSCQDDEQKYCECLGYNKDDGRLEKVVCDTCEAGITKKTCEDYNNQNLDNLTWVYDEGEGCHIADPPLPDRGG